MSEEIYEIIERIKFLKRNEPIEKFIMDKLISENKTQNKDKIKRIYNNLIKLLKFFNNIFQKEISNQRYSNILYINIFIIYHALDKLKKEVKPKIQECFKLIDNNEIYNLIETFILFDKNYSFYDHYKYNSKKNIFFNKSNKRLRKYGKDPQKLYYNNFKR